MSHTTEIKFASQRNYVDQADCVLFFAHVGQRTLRCYVTHRALSAYIDGGSLGRSAGQVRERCLAAFDRAVALIQRVARWKIEHDAAAAGGALVITSTDLVRTLCGADAAVRP